MAQQELTNRKGDWIQTSSGLSFYPLDPREEEVEIQDIAHALSLLCRFGGHCRDFYSVAEHCCHVSDAASSSNKLEGLLHDASEAYLVDVPRPIKRFLTNYKFIEEELSQVVYSKYGVINASTEIKELDNAILFTEAAQNMLKKPNDWRNEVTPLDIQLQYWSPREAEKQFLERFNKLWKQ